MELDKNAVVKDIPVNKNILIEFTESVDIESLKSATFLSRGVQDLNFDINQISDNEFIIEPKEIFRANTQHQIEITNSLTSINNDQFSGAKFQFLTKELEVTLVSVKFGSQEGLGLSRVTDVPLNLDLNLIFSKSIDIQSLSSSITIGNNYDLNITQKAEDQFYVQVSTKLPVISRFVLSISSGISGNLRVESTAV
jgi:hypothetical protein